MDFDCVVVGAGFAGLSAADKLAGEGRKVAVLEARDRVAGRVATQHLKDGTAVDVGGQWLGPGQDRAYALCQRFGIATYPSHVSGKNLLLLEGKRRSHRGHIPVRAPLWTLANLGSSLLKLEWLARGIELAAPWQSKNARNLDQRTLGDWLRSEVSDNKARSILQVGVESVFASHPDEISLLHALFYMRSGKNFDVLMRSEGGAQQDRVEGGVARLAEALADGIQQQGKIITNTRVERIVQGTDSVNISSPNDTFSAKRAIVCLPPALAAAIDYQPKLSSARSALLRRLPMGSVIKCIAAYERPFWRDKGWSGSTVSDEAPVHVTFDASPASGKPGLLLGFIEGEAARHMATESSEKRRHIVLSAFANYFGPQALRPVDYIERVWAHEEFSAGCYAAIFPPGVWTTVGHSIRRPEGRIHWAGTETATHWNGYIEGAIRSGERAAQEVLDRDV